MFLRFSLESICPNIFFYQPPKPPSEVGSSSEAADEDDDELLEGEAKKRKTEAGGSDSDVRVEKRANGWNDDDEADEALEVSPEEQQASRVKQIFVCVLDLNDRPWPAWS